MDRIVLAVVVIAFAALVAMTVASFIRESFALVF
jgi:hypothetical protein